MIANNDEKNIMVMTTKMIKICADIEGEDRLSEATHTCDELPVGVLEI